MDDIIKELTTTSTYLDERGHREHSYALDQMIQKLADKSYWEQAKDMASQLIMDNKVVPSAQKKVMDQIDKEEKELYSQEKEKVNQLKSKPSLRIQTIDAGSFPVRTVDDVKALLSNPRISEMEIKWSIYNAMGLDGQTYASKTTMSKALVDAVNKGLITK